MDPLVKLFKFIKGLIKNYIQAYCWHLKGWNDGNLMLASLLQYGPSYVTIQFVGTHKSV
jgi:hypothetical protein